MPLVGFVCKHAHGHTSPSPRNSACLICLLTCLSTRALPRNVKSVLTLSVCLHPGRVWVRMYLSERYEACPASLAVDVCWVYIHRNHHITRSWLSPSCVSVLASTDWLRIFSTSPKWTTGRLSWLSSLRSFFQALRMQDQWLLVAYPVSLFYASFMVIAVL